MQKLWGGRFSEETDALVNHFNASIAFDQRLWRHDIKGSLAHVKMLGNCGIITPAEAQEIAKGLLAVQADLESGKSVFSEEAEDVHMNVETLLREKIGPVAGKLHTGRSRNDQVATDIRLWLKDEIGELREAVRNVQAQLVALAGENIDTLLPGMTHLQHAQPVRLAHHLLAYFWMLERDNGRLADAYVRTDVLPLGAGALAGTSYPIDREFVAKELGFARISENSLDAVSDRDFAIETLSTLSLIMVHLSRLCEELILWNSQEFGFVTMGDNVTTGSSIMPQKKNPDVAELIRGKAGRVVGDLVSLLTVMKGLPLAYNKDMQEDKEPLFDGVDTANICLKTLLILLKNLKFNGERMAAALRGDFSTATDLADYLVRQGLPFREAHEVVGKIVLGCAQRNKTLEDLSADDLKSFHPLFAKALKDLTSARASADCRNTAGGTGREAVLSQVESAKAALSR
ncbi:MAG TPA: argininosuccinate lyase [Capsulimonadaceae bacterium]|nr:argininosuccinate lyase [Capsulimonadaceae bacterium]